MDIALCAFVFEFVLLCACATLCASVVVDPTPPPDPSQILSEWQRVGDLASAAAAAAAEEVCPNPSRETVRVIKIAARAATAATATALGGDPMHLSDVPWGAGPLREQRTASEARAAPVGQPSSGGVDQGNTHGGRGGGGAAGTGDGGGAERGGQAAGRGEPGLGRGTKRPRLSPIRKRRTPIFFE